jgi:phosphate starvation-inducible PhoH-like protein
LRLINQSDATTAQPLAGPGAAPLPVAAMPATARAVTLQFDDNALLSLLLGDHDRHLVRLEQGLGVRLACRGNRVAISGDADRVDLAQAALSGLYRRLERGESIRLGDIDAVIRLSEPSGVPALHVALPQAGTVQVGAVQAGAFAGAVSQAGMSTLGSSRGSRESMRESGRESGREALRDGGRDLRGGRGRAASAGSEADSRLPLSDLPAIRTKRGAVGPRSPGQTSYMEMLAMHEMVFALGPAGTGKTYLAVAQAVAMLQSNQVDRIVLSRPAVEAGERLGFLPGDMKEKVDPYLRPLYDALHDMMPGEQVIRRMGTGEIEVAPLAFMRGRTLSHAFVILDEAQNTTPAQMKMVLTRMGEGTRMVITGDLSQVDLPSGMPSGLRDAIDTLEGVAGIGVTRFTSRDVVRHPLVARIVDAYDQRSVAERDSRAANAPAREAGSREAGSREAGAREPAVPRRPRTDHDGTTK